MVKHIGPIGVVSVFLVALGYIFHNNLFHYFKMQDCSYIYVPGLVLSNPGITPSSHITKQLKNASGHFPVQHIPTII